MTDTERRASERQAVTFPVVVTTEGAVLAGQTVNASSRGLLLLAQGSITVLVSVKGKEYRGRLVRAAPVDRDAVAYAVELFEDLPEASAA